MKKFLLGLVILMSVIASFSCGTNQDSADPKGTDTAPTATVDAQPALTRQGPQPTETATMPLTPTATIKPTITKILLSYRGTPVSSKFVGEWIVYENRDYGFSFKYPQPMNSHPCGELIYNSRGHISQLNFEKGGILIMFSYAAIPSLTHFARNYPSQFGSELLTNVEQFTIGGEPAVRFVYEGLSSDTKKAYVIHDGTLFDFGFREGNFTECDTPELSEEQMYETIISTWQFLE